MDKLVSMKLSTLLIFVLFLSLIGMLIAGITVLDKENTSAPIKYLGTLYVPNGESLDDTLMELRKDSIDLKADIKSYKDNSYEINYKVIYPQIVEFRGAYEQEYHRDPWGVILTSVGTLGATFTILIWGIYKIDE